MSEQYNSGAINPFVNSLYSLLYIENHAKFYEKTFGQAAYSVNINSSFRLKSGFEYARRKALVNTTDFAFVDSDYAGLDIENKEYTSNNPQNPLDDAAAFETNNAFKFNAELTFYFKRKYESYPDIRRYKRSDKPVLTLKYEKGIAFIGSSVNYDYLDFSISDKFDFKNFGDSHYKVTIGGFLNNHSMYFMDYKHFGGNRTIFTRADYGLNNFNTLPYYEFSTNNSFLEAHYEHHFNGWVFNRLTYSLIAFVLL